METGEDTFFFDIHPLIEITALGLGTTNEAWMPTGKMHATAPAHDRYRNSDGGSKASILRRTIPHFRTISFVLCKIVVRQIAAGVDADLLFGRVGRALPLPSMRNSTYFRRQRFIRCQALYLQNIT